MTTELTQTIPPPLHNTLIQSPRPVRHISLPPARPLDNPLAIFLPGYRPPSIEIPRRPYKRTWSAASRAFPPKRPRTSPISPKRSKWVLLERLLNRPRSTPSTIDDPLASTRITPPRQREPSPLSVAHLPERTFGHSPRKFKRELIDAVSEEVANGSEASERAMKRRRVSEVEAGNNARPHRPPPLQPMTSSNLEPPKTPGSSLGAPLVSPVVTGFPVHTADEPTMNHVSDRSSSSGWQRRPSDFWLFPKLRSALKIREAQRQLIIARKNGVATPTIESPGLGPPSASLPVVTPLSDASISAGPTTSSTSASSVGQRRGEVARNKVAGLRVNTGDTEGILRSMKVSKVMLGFFYVLHANEPSHGRRRALLLASRHLSLSPSTMLNETVRRRSYSTTSPNLARHPPSHGLMILAARKHHQRSSANDSFTIATVRRCRIYRQLCHIEGLRGIMHRTMER